MPPQKITAYPTKQVKVGKRIEQVIQKSPYMERGRRVRFGACNTCGQYYLKRVKSLILIESKEKQRVSNKYRIFYVVCKHNTHGETEIERNLVSTLYLTNTGETKK